MGKLCYRSNKIIEKLNIEVIGQFPGYLPIEKLSVITQAEASIIWVGAGRVLIY